MALAFYNDSALKLKLTQLSPKRFLLALSGDSKTSSLWIGDPYTAVTTALVSPGATVLPLDQTGEFLPGGGTVVVNGQNLTYGAVTQSSLTGVAGVGSTINKGSVVAPAKKYLGRGNLTAFTSGTDFSHGISVGLKLPSDTEFGFSGSPVFFPVATILSGVSNALQLDLSVTCIAGIQQEFTNWALNLAPVFVRDTSDFTPIGPDERGLAPVGFGYVFRRDYALPQGLRVFPATRQIQSQLPGFIVGEYRWRDENTRNATALVPSNWQTDLQSIGVEKFTAGIGGGEDLMPVDLTADGDSLFLDIDHGHYFTGPESYYLPAVPELEFWPAQEGMEVHTLATPARSQSPIFVGTWKLDSQGFYEKDTEYHYIGITTEPNGDPREDLPQFYFTLNRQISELRLNQGLDNRTLFLGVLSGSDTDYFDVPVYPVYNVTRVYVDQGLGMVPIDSPNFVFNRDQGTIWVTNPAGMTPSVTGARTGQPVYAVCDPAVAVLYEAASGSGQRTLTEVDLNPAFSGLAAGYVYLQHRVQKPASITLSCDKPRIAVPASHQFIAGLIAFGPVYFDGDYALLSARAQSAVPGEVIPNALLQVIVGAGFTGTINYQDPTLVPITVVTGGDGVANLVYIPASGFGTWVPAQSAVFPVSPSSLGGISSSFQPNDTLVLPAPVPISQIRSAAEGWLVTFYSVFNNNPLLGKVGADSSLGEVAWVVSGIPGSTEYKTNGVRQAWRVGFDSFMEPLEARDPNGNNYNAVSFDGTVKQLVYSQPLPTDAHLGAYFVSYDQRVAIAVQAVRTNVVSNSIMLQMAVPDEITESPWLIVNDDLNQAANEDVFGRINVYRLGWMPAVNRGV